MKVKDRKTGEIKNVIYAPHRNKMVCHVEIDGQMKPFNDRDFDKQFEKVKD